MTTVKTSGNGTFEAETLAECIPFIKAQGTRHVRLNWTWNRVIEVDAPERWPFTGTGQYRARYAGTWIDDEYSYVGAFDEEAFREFAEGYGCWDGSELAVVDGVLAGDCEGYDPDTSQYPSDDEELTTVEWDQIALVCYEYYDEKAGKWRMMP